MESQKKSNIYFRVYYRLYLDIYNYFLHFERMVDDVYMVLGIDGMGCYRGIEWYVQRELGRKKKKKKKKKRFHPSSS